MSPGGWIIMLLSVGGTTGFFLWCIRRVMREPRPSETLHSPATMETPDVREDR